MAKKILVIEDWGKFLQGLSDTIDDSTILTLKAGVEYFLKGYEFEGAFILQEKEKTDE